MTSPVSTQQREGVDVVATIRVAAITLAGTSTLASDLFDAHGAVAELIAADKAYDEAWAAVCDADSDEAQIAADAALVAAHERRATALAACERAS